MFRRLVEYEIDGDGNKFVIGDGINFGGDRDWVKVVVGLVKKVYVVDGEFEEVIFGVVEEFVRFCRERIVDFM